MQAQRPGIRAFLRRWWASRPTANAPARPSQQHEPAPLPEPEAQDDVGAGDLLRSVSDVAWRLLVVGVVAGLLIYSLKVIWLVTLPTVLAVFLTALLMPLANWMRSQGLGRGSSTSLTMLIALVVLGGVITLIVQPAIQGFDQLVESVGAAVDSLQMVGTTFGMDPAFFTDLLDDAWAQIYTIVTENQDQVITGAWTAGTAVLQILIGLILVLVLTVYFVHSGDRLTGWLQGLLPAKSRPGLQHAGETAFGVMGRYVRGVATVGLIDAVGIGIALLILIDTNLAIPLIVLTFIGAFLPIIGAFVTGILAALVAFVTEGWIVALIVVGVVVLVQQLESNVFAPRVYGKSLELPAPVVLIAISVGGIVGGVPGMFLATPIVAVLAALLRNRPFIASIEPGRGDRLVSQGEPARRPAPEGGTAD